MIKTRWGLGLTGAVALGAIVKVAVADVALIVTRLVMEIPGPASTDTSPASRKPATATLTGVAELPKFGDIRVRTTCPTERA